MPTSNQRKLIEMLVESRDLPEEVVAVVELLLRAGDLSTEEVMSLVDALLKARDVGNSDWTVGGVIPA